MEYTWDLFLCHATEDKREFAEPLAKELEILGLKVWYDDFSLTPGSSLRRSIEHGISRSKFGVVVISENFFNKTWPQDELDIMFSLGAPLIPIWHRVGFAFINSKSPSIASRVGIPSDKDVRVVAEQIAKRVRPGTPERTDPIDCILCVGSAVGETVFSLKTIQLGAKNLAPRMELLGGSSYNHATRLLAMGYPVVPILSIGKDRTGERIQASLINQLVQLPEGKGTRIAQFVGGEQFFCPEMNTIDSTIVVSEGLRTILTGEPRNPAAFHPFLAKRLQALEEEFPDLRIAALMIGHIYADGKHFGKGAATKLLIERFRDRLVFVNFGRSQIELGVSFWRDALCQIGIFQLSLGEIREFFHTTRLQKTIEQVLTIWNGHHTSGVITLDRFGALATCPGKDGGVYVVWPHEIPDMVDPTGAGDAFGAGLVAARRSGQDFHDALENARIWAAYACTTQGGANDCPSGETLGRFRGTLDGWRKSQKLPHMRVEFINLSQLEQMFWIFDRAY